jgi:hypothetical protein
VTTAVVFLEQQIHLIPFEIPRFLGMPSSGMWRHVTRVRTDVSEESIVSVFRVRRMSELGTTLAVTSNQSLRHANLWVVDGETHAFLTSVLVGSEWSVSRPCRFIPGERATGTHWIGDCVGPRAGEDDMQNWRFLDLLGLDLRSLCRPAHSQSLYQLTEDGGDTYLGNVGFNKTHTAPQPRRWQS